MDVDIRIQQHNLIHARCSYADADVIQRNAARLRVLAKRPASERTSWFQ